MGIMKEAKVLKHMLTREVVSLDADGFTSPQEVITYSGRLLEKAGKVTEDMKGKIPNSIYEDSWELWVKYLAGELNMQEFLVEYQKFLKS